MASNYRIVTCADANFFFFLPVLEKNIYRKTGQYPIIYDLGLTSKQRARLKSDIISLRPPEGYNDTIPGGAIRTHHKPDCLIDFMERYDQNVLYIDADILMIDTLPVDVFGTADVAVTPRHPREMRSAAPFANGRINAGVLYFANTTEARTLLKQWRSLCSEGTHTDQMALSNLLEDASLNTSFGTAQIRDMTILKLDARIYNDIGRITGRLWHFKNAGRKIHTRRRWIIAALTERFAPKYLARQVEKQRERLLYTRSHQEADF